MSSELDSGRGGGLWELLRSDWWAEEQVSKATESDSSDPPPPTWLLGGVVATRERLETR